MKLCLTQMTNWKGRFDFNFKKELSCDVTGVKAHHITTHSMSKIEGLLTFNRGV